MTDVPPEEPVEPDEPEQTPETMAAELGLGIDLSPEEQAEAEQMVARLRSQFGLEETGQEEPEPESPESPEEPEVEEEEPEAPPVEEEPAQPSAEEWISIDGKAVPVAEARSMLELRQYLARNPEKAQEVRRVIEDQPKPEPVPEAKPPEWLDLEDPSQRFFWEQTQNQTKAIQALQAQQSEQMAEAARGRALGEVNSALETFRRNHPELSEDDVQTVRLHAVALNIIPGLNANMNGTDAVLKALDIAYLDHPTYRARATSAPTPAEKKQAESKERKQKLAGLGGSSSAASRQPEPERKPTTDREMRAQAAKWLSEQGIL